MSPTRSRQRLARASAPAVRAHRPRCRSSSAATFPSRSSPREALSASSCSTRAARNSSRSKRSRTSLVSRSTPTSPSGAHLLTLCSTRPSEPRSPDPLSHPQSPLRAAVPRFCRARRAIPAARLPHLSDRARLPRPRRDPHGRLDPPRQPRVVLLVGLGALGAVRWRGRAWEALERRDEREQRRGRLAVDVGRVGQRCLSIMRAALVRTLSYPRASCSRACTLSARLVRVVESFGHRGDGVSRLETGTELHKPRFTARHARVRA